ncbi:hypothetical protein GTW51_21090 [Aurantimonas aggregata]|uniref:RNA polymerase alpha subunit C-terminal domain-containing protein n=1 Tax=Aurantimonas aggregata TaxID=2047720 RepID=A0A6L9MP31_9HYPH|nr:hypothetical protein [Aurantimonas aggregata]NDV89168.1 hypothetical protein [Aurantimonas aggregata]
MSQERHQAVLRRRQDELSSRARNVLRTGRHAAKFGDWDERSRRLVEVAASYSREELLDEPNAGPVTVEEIAAWLAGKGLELRRHGSSRRSAASKS